MGETFKPDFGEPEQSKSEEGYSEKIITYSDDYKDKVINFFEEMEKEFPEIAGAKDVRNIPEWFQRDDESNFWLALGENNEIIGTAGLRPADSEKIGYLSRLYIKKDFRGKGIGKELTETRIKFAEKKDYKKIFSATMPDNEKVHEFEQKLGFKKVNVLPSDWEFGKGAIFFEMDLKNDETESK